MKKILIIAIVALFTSISSGLLAQNANQTDRKEQISQGYKVGDRASDFNLLGVDGKMYSLSQMEGAKGYIVVFTSNMCPFAVMYQDRLIALHNTMAPKGYPVVAINSNDAEMESGDSYENMKLRSTELNFPFVYLHDAKQEVYPKYGATKTPHVFLLDQDLKVQYIGAIDDNAKDEENVTERYVENAINALENGSLPNPNYTKAVGCPIKSKNEKGRDRARKGGRRGPPSPKMLMDRMDSNSDGKISSEEAHGPLKKDFERLDADKDGSLTIEELSKMKKGR